MRYGSEYRGGGHPRRDFGPADRPYDREFDWRGAGARGGRFSGRGYGWRDAERSGGWGQRPTRGGRGLDESWGAASPGPAYRGFDEPSWRRDPNQAFDEGRGGYGYTSRRHYMSGAGWGGHQASDRYDEDLGDRIRRGWDRFRDEARNWMGRGYDRGW